ncbi:MAG: hypothetical protein JW738_08285 [Actinobacteria bacterium]|nr:hypothetical protein [Actinomycetota bacterium]
MKKLLVALISLMLVLGSIAICATGCGGKSSAEAADILDKSNAAMQKITSFTMKTTGKYEMDMTEGMDQDIKMEMKADMSDPQNLKAQIVTSMMGMDTEMYLLGNYSYMEMPGMGWVKTPMADMGEYSQMTPEDISNMSKGAEDVKLVSEDGNSYEVSFTVGSKYFESAFEGDALGDELGEELSGMFEDMIKNMSMSAVFKIDKKTMYTTEAKVKMDMKDVPMIGNMTADMVMKYSDYNKPVTIELPPEAAAAPEIDPSELGTTPSLPGLPI